MKLDINNKKGLNPKEIRKKLKNVMSKYALPSLKVDLK